MNKRKEPGMFAESNQEEDSKTLKKHKELKNWARIKLIKKEKDRTKLN